MTISVHHKTAFKLRLMTQIDRKTLTLSLAHNLQSQRRSAIHFLIGTLIWTIADVGPHHVVNSHRQNAKLNDEWIKIWLKVLVDALNVFRTWTIASDRMNRFRVLNVV